MSAVEAEAVALDECLAAIDAGDKLRAVVWLRLADEANAAHAQDPHA